MNLGFFFFPIVLFFILFSVIQANLYCGERDCYDILGISQHSTAKEITKRYRELSLQYHPDRNPDPEADLLFREIATAYNVLNDPEKRIAYDHYITHPQDFAYNYGMYVKYVYQPKTDFRAVIFFFILVLSALQYLGQKTRYNSTMKQIRNSDQIKIKATHILMERSTTTQNGKSKSPTNLKERKKRKEKQKEQLQEIIDELIEDLQNHEKYKKPSIYDVLFFQIIIFPYTFAKWMKWQMGWIYRHTILRLPYNKEEKIYLTALALCITEEQFLYGDYDEEDQEDLLQRELWIPENLEKYDKELEEEMKERNPGKYKRMIRGKKNCAMDYADFDDD